MPDGALDADGLTLGAYLHGLFHNRAGRRSILACAGARRGIHPPFADDDLDPNVEYDKLAAFVRQHLDIDLVYRAMGLRQ